jgi:hypothetical protein
MPLRVHLSEVDVRRYVAGPASVDTERHVRVCVLCMQPLADATQRAFRWERRGPLRRLVRIDHSQEIDELLAEIEQEQRHVA